MKVDFNTRLGIQKYTLGGNDIRIEYTGKISGDSIGFTRNVGSSPAK